MYDPVRKDTADIEAKAIRHYRQLYGDLDELSRMGFLDESASIKESLRTILADKVYLRNIRR